MPVPVLRLSRACLIALAVCFVAAAVRAPAERVKAGFFSLVPPVGWNRTTQNVSSGVTAFLGPREQDFAVNINILSEPAPRETLAQYVGATHRQFAAHKEMTRLKDGTTVIAGEPAHTMLSELRVADHPNLPTLVSQQVYIMHKSRAFILTLTYPKDIAETSARKYDAAFRKSIASFKWER